MEFGELVGAIDSLQESVSELATKSHTQQTIIDELGKNRRDNKHNRMMISAVGIGLLLDLTLTAICGLLFHKANANTELLREVQQRTSNQVLCPLYKAFIDSVKVIPEAATDTAAQQAFRTQSIQVIENGYLTLHC